MCRLAERQRRPRPGRRLRLPETGRHHPLPWKTRHSDLAMTALDQAFIKAYAKDQPAAATLPERPEVTTPPAPSRTPSQAARGIEQIYHDGLLYRVESL